MIVSKMAELNAGDSPITTSLGSVTNRVHTDELGGAGATAARLGRRICTHLLHDFSHDLVNQILRHFGPTSRCWGTVEITRS